MDVWTSDTERCARAEVDALVGGDQAAWQRLLTIIAPHVERWTNGSWMLRRLRLNGEDDTRAVLVEVIARLRKDDFDNLRRFVDRRSVEPLDDGMQVVAKLGPVIVEAEPEPVPDTTGTPLRAWLLRLIRFVSLDHARTRLGYDKDKSKRSVATDASPLSGAPEHAHRPPITDALTARKVLEELSEAITGFPDDMQSALRLWMTDVSYDEIARDLTLESADKARNLVRAAHARLRAQFRERWLEVV